MIYVVILDRSSKSRLVQHIGYEQVKLILGFRGTDRERREGGRKERREYLPRLVFQ